MNIRQTALHGLFVIDIVPHRDNRGLFARTWEAVKAKEAGLIEHFDYMCVSTNTAKYTLRGMHYQELPHGEVKLVRCTRGAIFDVIIDMRPDSPTYKRWVGETLSEENHRALYVPPGCAHGFLTLEPESEVLYCIQGPFVPEAARGVRWDDPAFGIEWPGTPAVISDRDAQYSSIAS